MPFRNDDTPPSLSASARSTGGFILLVGQELTDFTGYFVGAVRDGGFTVHAMELRGLPPASRHGDYDALLPPPELRLRAIGLLRLVRGALSTSFRHALRRAAAERGRPGAGGLRALVGEALRAAAIHRPLAAQLAGYDLVNIHFLTRDAIRILPAIAPQTKVVVSFWGADLYAMPLDDAPAQLRALERADAITVHSLEMREVLLAKFGRHLAPKVRIVLFGLAEPIIAALDGPDPAEARRRFRAAQGIPPEATVVTVGYNASHEQNHVPVLTALSALPERLKREVVLVLPMTYGAAAPGYFEAVADTARRSGLQLVQLRSFLSLPELAELRLSTDVMIHVPERDALSASFIECLWGGASAIVGSWLPYGRLRSAGLALREVAAVGEVPDALAEVLKRLPALRLEASRNRERLQPFRSARQALLWLALFNELLTRRTERE